MESKLSVVEDEAQYQQRVPLLSDPHTTISDWRGESPAPSSAASSRVPSPSPAGHGLYSCLQCLSPQMRCCCGERLPMSATESLTLGPFEKWRRFNRFPYKLLINVLIVILTTLQIALFLVYVSPYTRAQVANFQALFQPAASPDSTQYLYRIPVVQQSVKSVVDTFYNIQNLSVDKYDYVAVDSSQAPPVIMTANVYQHGLKVFSNAGLVDSSVVTETYELSPDSLGPFEADSPHLKHFVYALVNMELALSLENYDIRESRKFCFIWDVAVKYDFSSRGRIGTTVSPVSRLCPSELAQPWYVRQNSSDILIFFAIFVLAILSQILHLKAILRSVWMYKHAKQRLKSTAPTVSWSALPCSKKLEFFNVWFFVASMGNVANIAGASLSLEYAFSGSHNSDAKLVCVGLGCLLAWVTMVQYFEHSGSYYVLIRTLRKGTPRVLRFLVGVLPVYAGYIMLGVAMFSQYSDKFSDIDTASVTLFSLLNGDEIHDVFDSLYPKFPLLSRIYLYSFIAMFIYAVLNIFIAIIEDAFFASKAFSLKKGSLAAGGDLLELLRGDSDTALNDGGRKSSILGGPVPVLRPSARERSKASGEAAFGRVVAVEKSVSDVQDELLRTVGLHMSLIEQKIVLGFSMQKQQLRSSTLQIEDSKTPPEISVAASLPKSERCRPPHDPSFFPCEFDDCLYCRLKGICEESFRRLEGDISQAILTYQDMDDRQDEEEKRNDEDWKRDIVVSSDE